MLSQKSVLARLLANENITVQQGNYQTAYFDVEKRVLGLPLWKDMGKDVYDMLVGHEVAHALYTPQDFYVYASEGIPQSWLNVAEDVRIEKLMLRKYPGLVGNFKRAYRQLVIDQDLFGLADKEVFTMHFMDRLNVKAKVRDLISIPFTEEEKVFVAKAMATETYEDVVNFCREVQAWLAENADANSEEPIEISMPSFPQSQGEGSGMSIPMPDMSADDAESQDGEGEGEGKPSDKDAQSKDGAAKGKGKPTDKETDEKGEGAASPESGEQSDSDDGKDSDATGKGAGGNKVKSGSSTEEAMTDVTFNERQKELLVAPTTLYVKGVDSKTTAASTVPYAKIAQARRDRIEEMNAELASYPTLQLKFPEADYLKFLAETKQVVNLMVKEFEMRKAAYRSARARTSTRGTLDVNKLHRFKYDDQLFKQISQLADAKSHGMMMLIDYSGSMHRQLPGVIRQLLSLLMFCRRVSIPFEVYAFTNPGSSPVLWTEIVEAKKIARNKTITSVDADSMVLLDLFKSNMSKRDFDEAFRMMFWQSQNYKIRSGYEELGSTPLNTALMAMQYKIKEFKKVYPVQKMTFITLTDGDSDPIYFNYGDDVQNYMRYNETVFDLDGKIVKLKTNGNNHRRLTTATLIKQISDMGCTTVNYFIAGTNSELNQEIRRTMYDKNGWLEDSAYRSKYSAIKRDINNEGCSVIDDANGYDRRFLIPAGNTLDAIIESLDIDAEMTAAKIAKAFSKANGSKKKSRVVTQKFAEIVA